MIHLGEHDGEDGVGAPAEDSRIPAECGAVGIAKNDQVFYFTVVFYQMPGQICTGYSFLHLMRTELRWTENAE